MTDDRPPHVKADTDPPETREWLDSLEYVLEKSGADRAAYLFERLRDRLAKWGAWLPPPINTPYVNTIPASHEPPYPGNLEIERRIRSLVRWKPVHPLPMCWNRSEGK